MRFPAALVPVDEARYHVLVFKSRPFGHRHVCDVIIERAEKVRRTPGVIEGALLAAIFGDESPESLAYRVATRVLESARARRAWHDYKRVWVVANPLGIGHFRTNADDDTLMRNA